MKLLAIDTSEDACSAALLIDDLVTEHFELAPRRHTELVLPMMDGLLNSAGLGLADLDALAFARGPGSFTGVRIAASIIQGAALGSGLPVVPVSSLQALAQGACREYAATRVLSALDARMQEVYTARFILSSGGLAHPDSVERVCAPESIGPLEDMGAAGNGFERYAPLAESGRDMPCCIADCWPHAASVSRIAAGWLKENEPLPADQAQPVYIRDKVADKPA